MHLPLKLIDLHLDPSIALSSMLVRYFRMDSTICVEWIIPLVFFLDVSQSSKSWLSFGSLSQLTAYSKFLTKNVFREYDC